MTNNNNELINTMNSDTLNTEDKYLLDHESVIK